MAIVKDFKEFIARGNVLDLAVAVVIGAAFGKIITSFVNDILMPPIGLILGKVDFSGLFLDLSGKGFATLDAAQKVKAPTINYGIFLNAVIDFLIVAFCVFLLVRQVSRFMPKKAPAVEPVKCPFCLSPIEAAARRCPHCTSMLGTAQEA